MKPGINTSEFWLCVICITGMIALAIVGALTTSTAICTSTIATIYAVMRSLLKSKDMEEPDTPPANNPNNAAPRP